MGFKKTALASLVGAAMAVPSLAQAGELQWFGSIYMKFLDGNMHANNGMYNFGGTSPDPSTPTGGDQGQAVEFELMFKKQVSKQVEIGGRLKGRFNRNYWANFGGFGPDEQDPRNAQYFKVRGTYVTVTPGYDWIDSVTLGSNDFGQFDPWTLGKMRYTDRDNASGIVAAGSFGEGFRWDFARLSLPKLWAGPGWKTTRNATDDYQGSLFAQDAAYAFQLKYSGSDLFTARMVAQHVIDEELDLGDNNTRDGRSTQIRTQNNVIGGEFNFTGSDMIGVGTTLYYSDLTIDEGAGTGEWSPVLNEDATDWAGKINVDINELPIDDLQFNIELFHIGSEYQSIVAARREADVLLTEGHDGIWMAKPGNYGLIANNGMVGFNGNAHQLPTLNIDNEFADFDEVAAQSVLGWKGFTIVPKFALMDWNLSGEFTLIDYDSNWQNFGGRDEAMPQNEGGGYGIGGGYRSPYAPDQEKLTAILVAKADTRLDVGTGLDVGLKYKFIDEVDERVTSESRFQQRYSGGAMSSLMNSIDDDDREMEYHLFEPSVGYQVTEDLYAKATYSYYDIELNDGHFAFGEDVRSALLPYQTGDHERHSLMLQFDYFLPGLELGSTLQWINHDFNPEFPGLENLTDTQRDAVVRADSSGQVYVQTGTNQQINFDDPDKATAGLVKDGTQKFRQYRMKTWVKVKF